MESGSSRAPRRPKRVTKKKMNQSEAIGVSPDGFPYHGIYESTREAIVNVLERLPEDARRFAVEECVFISIGGYGGLGMTLPANIVSSRAKWIIVLSDILRQYDDYRSDIIAHELAHAWLEHKPSDRITEDEMTRAEKEANELSMKWGFKSQSYFTDWSDELGRFV